jgi:hypothetical protein
MPEHPNGPPLDLPDDGSSPVEEGSPADDVLAPILAGLTEPRLGEAFEDLRLAYRVAPSEETAQAHLAKLRSITPPSRRHRGPVVAGIIAGLLLLTTGLAGASALPAPIQNVVSDVLKPLGLDLPRSANSVDPAPQSPSPPEDPAGLGTEGGEGPPITPPGQDQTPGPPITPPGQDQTPGPPITPPGQDQTPGPPITPPGQEAPPPGQQQPPGQEAPGQPPGQGQNPPAAPPGEGGAPSGQDQSPPAQGGGGADQGPPGGRP